MGSRRFISIAASLLPSSILDGIAIKKKRKRIVKNKKTTKQKKKIIVRKARKPLSTSKQEDVYVLELQGGRVYVGKSSNVSRRLQQHMQGYGSEFTKVWKPTGKLLPRLGDLVGSGDGPERDETLRQMYSRGVDKVRGWRYCARTLRKQDLEDIKMDLRELGDLCRICGRSGHLAKGCRSKRR
jgi:predicted GTPase